MSKWLEFRDRVGGEWSGFYEGWSGVSPVEPFCDRNRLIVARSTRGRRRQYYHVRQCGFCRGDYLAAREQSRYCSDRCHAAAKRALRRKAG